MSSTSLPISTTRFAAALPSLPLSALYAKHAELTNATAHLIASNAELEKHAREHDDRECFEAVLENREVMARFEERREAIKREVEARGLMWMPEGEAEVRKIEGEGGAVLVEEGRGRGEQGRAANAEERGDEGVFL